MGSYVLRGITTALLVTVVTLFAGILWGTMGLGGPSVSQLLDIGLLVSCLVGGYRTAKESGAWFLGGVTGAGYVVVGTLLLALFLPIRGLGFIQILAEGALLGLVAGVIGGGKKGAVSTMWNGGQSRSQSQSQSRYQYQFTPSYVGYDKDESVNSNFEWDTDEELRQKANTSNLDWLENSEDKVQERQETTADYREDAAVEWPWDREDDIKFITRDPDPEPNQVRNDVVVWDKCGEKAKPWWEQ